VLLGPGLEMTRSLTIGELKQHLVENTSHGFQKSAIRLLYDRREFPNHWHLSDFCADGAKVILTCLICENVASELVEMTHAAQDLKRKREQASEQWSEEFPSASPLRKREQREADISEYRGEVTELVQQLGESAIQQCRIEAKKGNKKCNFDIQGLLQRYELGAKLFFIREQSIWRDPVLRGWYFSSAPADVVDAPDQMTMGNRKCHDFMNYDIMPELVHHLQEKGLHAMRDEHCIHTMTIAWFEDRIDTDEA